MHLQMASPTYFIIFINVYFLNLWKTIQLVMQLYFEIAYAVALRPLKKQVLLCSI